MKYVKFLINVSKSYTYISDAGPLKCISPNMLYNPSWNLKLISR